MCAIVYQEVDPKKDSYSTGKVGNPYIGQITKFYTSFSIL